MGTLDAKLAQTQQAHRRAMAALFDRGRGERAAALARIPQCEYLDATAAALDGWLEAALRDVRDHQAEAADPVTFRPLIVEFWPLGVHYVDALFGAAVYPRDGNFWADRLDTEPGDLRPIHVERDGLVQWTIRAMERVLAALPPAWGLTTPVLSSPLNIAVNLFGQRVLEALTAPTEADRRGLAAIAAAIADLHRLMRRRFPSPRVRFYASSSRWAPDGVGHICGCTTQLVGPDTYLRHIAPLDSQILNVYPQGGTIHLCGRHTQHIPCWRDMPELRGVQLNDAAADDFCAYAAGLRDDQVIYVAPTPEMTVRRILDASAGRRVVLQTLLESAAYLGTDRQIER